MTLHTTSSLLKKEEPDQYGQTHPLETDELINASLHLMNTEIDKLSFLEKKDLLEAYEKCPEVSKSDAHKLMFLRCEQFNADAAATRLAKYWSKRIEIFESHAFDQDLTLDNALKDDKVALKTGFIKVLPIKDKKGRAVAFVTPRNLDSTKYTRESMVRVTWYMIHAMLEDEIVQQKGIVFIINLAGAKVKHFDIPLVNQCSESVKGILPVRVSALHFCQPPIVFDVLYGVVKLVLGERLRKRIIVHSQMWLKEDDVKMLEEYGFNKNELPTDIGGILKLNHQSWLEKREAHGK